MESGDFGEEYLRMNGVADGGEVRQSGWLSLSKIDVKGAEYSLAKREETREGIAFTKQVGSSGVFRVGKMGNQTCPYLWHRPGRCSFPRIAINLPILRKKKISFLRNGLEGGSCYGKVYSNTRVCITLTNGIWKLFSQK